MLDFTQDTSDDLTPPQAGQVTAASEQALLHAIQDPKGNIAGFRRGDLMTDLARFSLTRLSRQMRRLLDLGVVKRVAGTYRYYLTRLGRAAIAAACSLTRFNILPALAAER